MQIEIFPSADQVAERAAAFVAAQARAAIAARGRFLLAVSGGSTPWAMLKRLAESGMPWPQTHIFQVDERAAPDGHAERNLTHLLASLEHAPVVREQIYPMPVVDDLQDAAETYAALLKQQAGAPPVLDLVHLGLGDDGHTASLVPDDPVLQINQAETAVCGEYQGRRRLTLTYPALNRARAILWLLAGAGKAPMLRRLIDADPAIPAGIVEQEHAFLFADAAAATLLTESERKGSV